MAAKECVTRKINECGILESTNPKVVEAMRYLRVANRVVNYVCRDHVEGTQSFVISLLPRPATTNAGLVTVSFSRHSTFHTYIFVSDDPVTHIDSENYS